MDDDIAAALARAKTLMHVGQHADALVVCDAIISSNPSRYEPFELRSSIHRKLNSLADSISDIDRVIALVPDSAAPHFRKGRYLASAGRYEEAIVEFTKAIERDNGYFREALLFHRAEARLRVRDYSGALCDCRCVSPDHVEHYFYDHSLRSRGDIEREAEMHIQNGAPTD